MTKEFPEGGRLDVAVGHMREAKRVTVMRHPSQQHFRYNSISATFHTNHGVGCARECCYDVPRGQAHTFSLLPPPSTRY